jgi:hypothetical protein
MKKLLALAALSVASLCMSTSTASAWIFNGCCHRCCATICCKPYNAFSPCCPVTIRSNGCCPVLNCCGPAAYGCGAGACGVGGCCGGDGAVGELPNIDGSGGTVVGSPMPSAPGTPTTMAPPTMPAYTVPGWNGGMVPGMNTGYAAPMYNQGYMPSQYPAQYPGYAPMAPGYGGMNPAAYFSAQPTMAGAMNSPVVHNAFNPSSR